MFYIFFIFYNSYKENTMLLLTYLDSVYNTCPAVKSRQRFKLW